MKNVVTGVCEDEDLQGKKIKHTQRTLDSFI